MIYFIKNFTSDTNPLFGKLVTWFMLIAFTVFVVYKVYCFLESLWVEYVNPKPFFRNFYIVKRKLTSKQLQILKTEFSFYNKLNKKDKSDFEHRLATFLKHHQFEGKSGFEINDRVKILIAATGIMLTFGYRSYKIPSVQRFLIYPEPFFSNMNKNYHKGEFNPAYKAIVLSWKDFLHGYDISNDNFNLGIHEYVHAMHFEYLRNRHGSLSSAIFVNAYNELRAFLDANDGYKHRLVASKYLRDYAYTNQFEFVSVLIESFMETPEEFNNQFPEMYSYVKQMLNFDFAGY